jgi:DNA repair exonuclease SbcCD ATPase subunit
MSDELKQPAPAPEAPQAEELDPLKELEALRAKYEKAQKDLTKFRTRAEEVDAARKQAEAEALKQKPLEERLTAAEKKAAELEARALEAEAKRVAAERRAALTGKVADPTAALKLLEDAHLTEDGSVNVEALLAAYPFLAPANPKAPPTLPGAPSGVGAGKPLTLDSLRGRSIEEINAHWDEIKAANKR